MREPAQDASQWLNWPLNSTQSSFFSFFLTLGSFPCSAGDGEISGLSFLQRWERGSGLVEGWRSRHGGSFSSSPSRGGRQLWQAIVALLFTQGPVCTAPHPILPERFRVIHTQ